MGEKRGRLNLAEFRYCWGVSLSMMSVHLETEESGSKDKRGLEGTWAITERVWDVQRESRLRSKQAGHHKKPLQRAQYSISGSPTHQLHFSHGKRIRQLTRWSVTHILPAAFSIRFGPVNDAGTLSSTSAVYGPVINSSPSRQSTLPYTVYLDRSIKYRHKG